MHTVCTGKQTNPENKCDVQFLIFPWKTILKIKLDHLAHCVHILGSAVINKACTEFDILIYQC